MPGTRQFIRAFSRGWVLFLTLGVTLALLMGSGAAAVETGVAPLTLTSLKIKGAKIIPARRVKEELSIPLPSRWPWKKDPAFRANDLEADVERLQIFYRRRGFYHAKIRPEIFKDEQGRVKVVLHIDEGPWVMVKKIEVQTSDPALQPALNTLKEKWPLTPGDRFTEELYENLKRLYLDYLTDHGYPRAAAEGKVYLDDAINTADIQLTLTPGPLCTFGDVSLKGERVTPDYLILRKLAFQKGDIFSLSKLYESQRRLYGLDLFRSVTLTPEEVPEKERAIPITAEVVEAKKRSLKVGLGYGDEDQVRARLGLRWRNLGGGGRLLDLDGKYSSLETRITGSFLNPQLWSSFWDLSFQTGWITRDFPGFNDRAFFAQTRFERDLPWSIRVYLGHGLEFARPFDIPTDTLLLLGEPAGKTYTSSALQAGLRQDKTDNPVDPTQGWIFFVNGDLAADYFGSNLKFGRLVLDGRKYQRAGKTGLVMAGRVKFGIIEPLQNTEEIPVFKRFFAGGANSVRGYRLDYLGPRNASGQPIGGEALLEAGIEARIPIYKEFRGVAFFDCGNVFFKTSDIDVGQLKYAAGFGLRYVTPIGPIGVDVGFPLNRINPNQDPSYRIHLTIGQAF
jgi:outer membrane protein assembly complex protein YaeT